MTDPRRALPSVERLLSAPEIGTLLASTPRAVVVAAVRGALHDARVSGAAPPPDGWAAAVGARVRDATTASLRPVINATGIVLHTNLGRAPVAPMAIEAGVAAAGGYSTLELDLDDGTRGSRQAHCRDLLCELTGAEEALVVNNAAGALLLALAALAEGGRAVVSRGELIEIGGSFRLPDIIEKSGARLHEVGTTNRTHARDYESAVDPETRILLKVHRSNFALSGFTSEVSALEIARLAQQHGLQSVFDVGSGLLIDLAPWGLTGEPLAQAAVATGVDLVLFSGDKLLGGPQAGCVVGRRDAVQQLARHPIARAVRADKFTIGALAATLALYRDAEHARETIPTLRMLTCDADTLEAAAQALVAAMPPAAGATVMAGHGEVGGGSFPGVPLPTTLAALSPTTLAPAELQRRLRVNPPHVVARLERDRVLLDPRTILPGEDALVASAVAAALDG
jgi:L-seryl-tRNA(Ser) seleniumtransferase